MSTLASSLRLQSNSCSVPQAFDVTIQSLSIEASRAKASKQQQGLRDNLAGELAVLVSFLTGSYRRGTQIPPLDDIDVLLVLDPTAYASDLVDSDAATAAILRRVHRALATVYPRSEIVGYDRCIRIAFTGTGIGFDITPAFQQSEDVFLIPDLRQGRWIATNPKSHQQQISYANQNVCGQQLVPLVKLLKLWNLQHGSPLSGFHLEVMAFRALTQPPKDLRHGLACLFDALATSVPYRTPDPWPGGVDVDAYLTPERREKAVRRLAEATDLAVAAVRAESTGDVDGAHWRWRQILGERYPEPGRKPDPPQRLSPFAAASAIAVGGIISATSAGLVSPSSALASARSGTSHGGELEAEPEELGRAGADSAEADRQIEAVLRQFTGLRRMPPDVAVRDPSLGLHGRHPTDLHAVLVGEQRTNLGGRHRIVVAVPAGAPISESYVYAPDYVPRHAHDGRGRYRPVRNIRHCWRTGALCTHAQIDRWDGRLVTLVIWAAEWLFRQDYHQRTGVWLGAEVTERGRRRVARVHGGRKRRASR